LPSADAIIGGQDALSTWQKRSTKRPVHFLYFDLSTTNSQLNSIDTRIARRNDLANQPRKKKIKTHSYGYPEINYEEARRETNFAKE